MKLLTAVLMVAVFAAPASIAAQGEPSPAPADSNSAHSGTVLEAETVRQVEAVTPLSPALEKRARGLNEQLRCPVCQSSSIEESPAREATEMKAVVRKQLADGKTDQEIIDYFLSRYGDWVMLAPPKRGFNLLVYVLPLLLVLGGGVFVYRTARRWVTSTA